MKLHKLVGVFAAMAMTVGLTGGVNAADGAPDCSRSSGSLPNNLQPAGTPNSSIPIEHVVVIMQENRSFDSYFGRLNSAGYEGQVDGLSLDMSNRTRLGHDVKVYHSSTLCIRDITHDWNAMHVSWNKGKGDGFVLDHPARAMAYYDQRDLQYYYALANQFAIGDRYFSSVLSQTYPNRYFLLAGTAFGQVANIDPSADSEYHQKTLFHVLDENGVSWKYYYSKENYLKLFKPLARKDAAKMVPLAQYKADLAAGKLPQVVFLESSEDNYEDEHPSANIHIGQAWVADKVNALMKSDYWKSSVLFLTYDENGGFFDHVVPPLACAPDDIRPVLSSKHLPGDYEHLGFRVPFIAVSPYAKHHYVSHVTYDHTSILKFIETKFNLPALTRRDANADAMLDLFDFEHPVFKQGLLPDPSTVSKIKALECTRAGD